mgnify:CR=1 FL=1
MRDSLTVIETTDETTIETIYFLSQDKKTLHSHEVRYNPEWEYGGCFTKDHSVRWRNYRHNHWFNRIAMAIQYDHKSERWLQECCDHTLEIIW